ncbi:MAG: glycosyltransferase family 9 protein [Candidatus Nanoarchaeia archaeon]
MEEKDLYKIRNEINQDFNYKFDKITSIFVKSKKNIINNPKKILFIRNDHIGDMVYSTHIFREVKKNFPDAKISVIATKSNREIIEKDKNIDKIFEIDLFWRRGWKGFLDYLKIIRKIRKEGFDVGIDLRRSKLNIIFFLWLGKIKSRAGYFNINGGKAFLTHPIILDKTDNYIYENLKLVNETLGINIKKCLPHISTDKEDEDFVYEFLKENKLKKYVVFAPGATADSKRWPKEKFMELIDRFHNKYPKYKIILSGANSDREIIQELASGRNYCMPLINFNLRLMSIVFKKAGAVVANDGCATDISWVAGGKLVCLVGPVDLNLFRFLGKTKILHHKTECYPCFWANPCPMPKDKWCMNLITVEEVMKAITAFMKKK